MIRNKPEEWRTLRVYINNNDKSGYNNYEDYEAYE